MVTPTWVRRPAAGARLIHVNATATGGGVAELLAGLVPAQVADGTPTGWAVIAGDEEFFAFTKHVHHLLHDRGGPVSSKRLGAAVPHYRAVLEPQAEWLAEQVGAGDVVVLHDPQTLGMAPVLSRTGAKVLWHCHIGTTDDSAAGPGAVWQALQTELATVDGVVTTLPEFAPSCVPLRHRHLAAPAIDPASAKNRPLSRGEAAALLDAVGLTGTPAPGRPGTVEQDGPLPEGARVVVQVSRWDPLKDMAGVVRLVPALPRDVHVVLAGNDPDEIPDDPEGRAVLAGVRAARADLPPAHRARVHLVLPSARAGERAALLVNALQRRADVVLQKSLAEGFGMTVTEAMFKGRAVVASDVGGLRQQISPGHNGILVEPRQPDQVVPALRALLDDALLRHRLGRNATASATRRYLLPRLVADYRSFAAPAPLAEVA